MATTKTLGRDFNFFKKVTVTWNTFGGGNTDGKSPEIIIPFSTQGFILMNEDNSSIIEVSMNGSIVHDELNPGLPSKALAYDNRVASFIWFRLKSGASAVVSIRAWAK